MDSSKRMSFIREENLIERLQYYQVFSKKILWCQAELIACHVSSILMHLVTDLHNFSLSVFLP